MLRILRHLASGEGCCNQAIALLEGFERLMAIYRQEAKGEVADWRQAAPQEVAYGLVQYVLYRTLVRIEIGSQPPLEKIRRQEFDLRLSF